jgi:hypothetical protein
MVTEEIPQSPVAEAPAPHARLADDSERRPANVGPTQRAVAEHRGHVLTKSGFTVFRQLRLLPLL